MLRLHKPKTDKRVQWKEEVVDNEFLGRKSSKCELGRTTAGSLKV